MLVDLEIPREADVRLVDWLHVERVLLNADAVRWMLQVGWCSCWIGGRAGRGAARSSRAQTNRCVRLLGGACEAVRLRAGKGG